MSFDLNGNEGAQSGLDKDMQDFLMVEQQKAQFQMQVHKLTEMCWDKCMDKPSNRIDGRTETCLTNCVERFIDTSLSITNRFAQLLQKSSGGME